MQKKHTIVILNPGHFHAALTLRERHPLIDDDVHVFAEDGPDVDHFVRLVHSFNDREVDPTDWMLYVHRGADYMEKLIAQRPGEVVIVAGRNNEKIPLIHILHAQGFRVLGDKPWLIESEQIGLLREVTASAPLAMDIMTERHEVANRVQKALVQQSAVFGDFRIDGDQPAIAVRSVHHLYKRVNNRPLQRPAWYFDPAVQGEGITDVTTHLVDLVQWMTGDGVRFDFDWHVERLSARQWPTAIPRDLFSRITGLEDFPAALRDRVADGALQYLCNAALSYRLRGIPVEIETLWALEEPEGSGDLHRAILRGTKSDLIVDQGPETGFLTMLTISPAEGGKVFAEALTDAVAKMQTEFPGLGVEPAGAEFRITIPKALRTTHEQYFAAVLQTFLAYIDEGRWPGNLGSDLDTKYTLLAQALDLSHRSAAAAPRVELRG
ncbi:MAG: oxidoreductase [Betaproteobacteria bacterium]|nr:oxidoreductase [Betaproteobacteria bacterium]